MFSFLSFFWGGGGGGGGCIVNFSYDYSVDSLIPGLRTGYEKTSCIVLDFGGKLCGRDFQIVG